jgi:hypothetical protein
VPWIFGEVIPRLAPSVHVHVHDIFLPGDYPEPWVSAGWGGNEIYLVRSFLSYNSTFEVVWGAQYMLQNHPEAVLAAFPGQREYEERGAPRCGCAGPTEEPSPPQSTVATSSSAALTA